MPSDPPAQPSGSEGLDVSPEGRKGEAMRETAEAALGEPWCCMKLADSARRFLLVTNGFPAKGSLVEIQDAPGVWPPEIDLNDKEAAFVSCFDPPTVLALLDRLEALERVAEALEELIARDIDSIAEWRAIIRPALEDRLRALSAPAGEGQEEKDGLG